MLFVKMTGNMKPFHNLLAALLVLSALQAQTPWTNWGIYRDSTGNGVNSVSGGLVCSDDTLWLVVDTTGMGAAGITSWRWRFNGPTPNLVYCPGGGDCPTTLPGFFPFSGVSNEKKLGIKPLSSAAVQSFTLTTYYSNGDSLISVKSYTIKGGSATLSLPSEACPSTNVPGSVSISGVLDSFIVTYGTTTIRNQANFNVAIPSGSGTLTVTLTYYVCGNPTAVTFNINYPITLTPPSPITITPSGNSCPTSPIDLSTSVPNGYTSFVWTVNGTPVTTGTNHPVPYTWLPSGPGTYTIAYTATYPCGTMTDNTTYTISAPPAPSLSINVSPSVYCPGQNFFVSANAGSAGLYTIDIGNDGTIEAYSNFYTGSVSSIPTGGLPIRVKFDNGCGGTADNTILYNPSQPSQPVASTTNLTFPSGIPRCPNSPITVQLNAMNFPIDSIKNIQWSWDGTNWTSPSNNSTVTLTTPNTPGPWTLYYQFTANSPALCLTTPPSPSNFTITPFNIGPQVIVLGSLCASGGTVRFVPQSFSTNGMDSIRYTLPNGTIINKGVTDTLVVSIPAGTSTYTILAQGYTPCGLSMPSYENITLSQQAPSIQTLSVSPNAGCPGMIYNVFVSFPFGTTVDSVVVVLWNSQRIPLAVLFSSANGTFTGPNTAGSYTVTAIAYSCAGNDTATTTIQVSSSTQAVANFTAPSSACVGQPVTFQRTGSNAGISSVSWSFGGGGFSTDTSLTVTHTYTAPGLYTVYLSLNSAQCGFTTFQRTIRVYDAPPTLSGLNVTSSGLTINYGVATASDYDQIVWNFGDGNTTTGVLSGTHTYASAGSYTVKVQAINACDTTELTTTVSVTTGLLSGEAGAWVVYPNPARQEVFFSHPTYRGDVRVEIYDLTGRLVQAEAFSSYPVRLRLSVPNGLYTLRLISLEGVTTTKLLVE